MYPCWGLIAIWPAPDAVEATVPGGWVLVEEDEADHRDRSKFSAIEIPYAYKLFTQQMESMNISMRMFTEINQKDMFLTNG